MLTIFKKNVLIGRIDSDNLEINSDAPKEITKTHTIMCSVDRFKSDMIPENLPTQSSIEYKYLRHRRFFKKNIVKIYFIGDVDDEKLTLSIPLENLDSFMATLKTVK